MSISRLLRCEALVECLGIVLADELIDNLTPKTVLLILASSLVPDGWHPTVAIILRTDLVLWPLATLCLKYLQDSHHRSLRIGCSKYAQNTVTELCPAHVDSPSGYELGLWS